MVPRDEVLPIYTKFSGVDYMLKSILRPVVSPIMTVLSPVHEVMAPSKFIVDDVSRSVGVVQQTATKAASSFDMTKSGIVKDASGLTLFGATLSDSLDKYNGEVVDQWGVYSITANSNSIIHISYMGYKSRDIRMADLPENIILEEEDNQLNEVDLGTIKNKKETNNLLWIGVLISFLILIKTK